ncbi:MAG: translocation/assembly module TamB [Candidatus Omnitrophica bacterium]|nr:translocation/assembly module TamB [Candidatus Omnitrophota bacterium]MBU4477898.1 translocation/assembly module TamB [Candidatus Omnitrophota bacterium]MCG2704205.1 translocation/assembly module TamB [Candidatus Omnitrophota bacterium]
MFHGISHTHKENIYFLIVTAMLLCLLLGLAGHYFLYTASGSGRIARMLLSYYVEADNLEVEKIEGSFAKTLSFHNIVISGARKLPPGTVVKIQRLDVKFVIPALRGLVLEIYNGRLQLPLSDTILFYGDYRNRSLDLKVYARRVSAREMLDLFAPSSGLNTVSGIVSDINLHLSGTLFSVILQGKFFIEKITNDTFSITDCPGSVMIYMRDIKRRLRLNGEIVFNSGKVSGLRTALIRLKPSKIVFEKDPKNPKISVRGTAKVEKTKISVFLHGSIHDPQLRLSSYPPLTEELLLIMLATGKSWGGTQMALEQGQVSADIIRDFVDYFFFSGKGDKIAKRFGLSDISVTYDSQTKGIGVKTSLADKAQVRYEVQNPQGATGQNTPVQTVSGEVKITDTISVEAEKGLTSEKKSPDASQPSSQGEEKVFLKFQKNF